MHPGCCTFLFALADHLSQPLTHCQIMFCEGQLYTMCVRFTSQFWSSSDRPEV